MCIALAAIASRSQSRAAQTSPRSAGSAKKPSVNAIASVESKEPKMSSSENMSQEHDRIITGMATILWGHAWASAAEALGQSLAGQRIEEIMPPIPKDAWVQAIRLAGQYEGVNACEMSNLYYRAMMADGREGFGTWAFYEQEQRFGECLAWMALGAGVSWFDDHKHFEIEVPRLIEHDASLGSYAQTILWESESDEA